MLPATANAKTDPVRASFSSDGMHYEVGIGSGRGVFSWFLLCLVLGLVPVFTQGGFGKCLPVARFRSSYTRQQQLRSLLDIFF